MSSTPIYASPLCSCIVCHETKSAKGIHSHFLIAHTDAGKTKNENQRTSTHKNRTNSRHISNLNKYNENPNRCLGCNDVLEWSKRMNKFCSHSCAAETYNKQRLESGWRMSEQSRNEISNKLRGTTSPRKGTGAGPRPFTPVSSCMKCGKWYKGVGKYCKEHMPKSYSVKRSKDEVALYELCRSHFSNVTHNEPIFNGWDADIIIYDTKTAISWNGPWHYQEMPGLNHSLLQVQTRDKIKQKEVTNAGWNLIVFEDRYHTPESAFSFLINTLEPISV